MRLDELANYKVHALYEEARDTLAMMRTKSLAEMTHADSLVPTQQISEDQSCSYSSQTNPEPRILHSQHSPPLHEVIVSSSHSQTSSLFPSRFQTISLPTCEMAPNSPRDGGSLSEKLTDIDAAVDLVEDFQGADMHWLYPTESLKDISPFQRALSQVQSPANTLSHCVIREALATSNFVAAPFIQRLQRRWEKTNSQATTQTAAVPKTDLQWKMAMYNKEFKFANVLLFGQVQSPYIEQRLEDCDARNKGRVLLSNQDCLAALESLKAQLTSSVEAIIPCSSLEDHLCYRLLNATLCVANRLAASKLCKEINSNGLFENNFVYLFKTGPLSARAVGIIKIEKLNLVVDLKICHERDQVWAVQEYFRSSPEKLKWICHILFNRPTVGCNKFCDLLKKIHVQDKEELYRRIMLIKPA